MEITLLDQGGEARVDSRVIATAIGNQHKNVMSLVGDYQQEFESFGILPFETEKSTGAGRPERYALLNEDQSYFLLTLVRNAPQVVALKVGLVKAFKRARDAAPPAPALPSTPLGMLRLALDAMEAQEARVTALEQRLDAQPVTGVRLGTIHRLGQELGRLQGNYAAAWRLFNGRFGLASYRDLPSNQYDAAVTFLRLQIQAYGGQVLLEEHAS